MDNRIIIIATTSALADSVKAVLAERELAYPVHEAVKEDALSIAETAVAEGTKVIVCRGVSTAYLRQHVPVPVVDIRHGFVDIHLSIQRARELGRRPAVVGGENLCSAARVYKDIENADLIILAANHEDEFEQGVRQAVDLGADVVIGGFQVERWAKALGVASVMGQADHEAIHLAISEAVHDLRIEEERREKFQTINAILNCASEGIIGFRDDGSIIHINDLAKNMLGYQSQVSVTQLLPPGKYLDSAQTGASHFNELLEYKGQILVLNSVPIQVDNRVLGAVTTLQREKTISNMDIKIRKKHLARGHVAKKTFSDIVGNTPVMRDVVGLARSYASASSTVLICGETGTGKEVFAQSIHNDSVRAGQPFVAINCAALSETILESELFGYVKGAFTGARSEGKEGIFELAHRGTVFLDEIGEVSNNVQVKLLRILQEKEVSRLGDDRIIPVDVRIIAATNRDLRQAVGAGQFREDLFYRLCVLELRLPALAERREDIPELTDYLIRQKYPRGEKRITPEAKAVLAAFHWPGNIRHLDNIIQRLAVVAQGSEISEDDVHTVMAPELAAYGGGSRTGFSSSAAPMPADPKGQVIAALEQADGNRQRAADLLGISTTTLWRRMKTYNLF